MGCSDSKSEHAEVEVEEELEDAVEEVEPEWIPSPPTSRKSTIFDKNKHRKVDRYARKLSDYEHLDVPKFLRLLTRKSLTSIGRLRAIFVWMCYVDLDNLKDLPIRVTSATENTNLSNNNAVVSRQNSDLSHVDDNLDVPEKSDPKKMTMLEHLHQLRDESTNRAHLFALLCKCAKIECEVINGINKSAKYNSDDPPHTRAKQRELSAQWNAVELYQEWRLINVEWACSCLLPGQGKSVRMLNEFYFLTDPDIMIGTHYPYKSKWQLLPYPITIERFFEMAQFGDRFFKMELIVTEKTPLDYKLSTNTGEVSISFQASSPTTTSTTRADNKAITEIDDEPIIETVVQPITETNVQPITEGDIDNYIKRDAHFKCLLINKDDENECMDRFVMYERTMKEVTYTLRFNKRGMYKFSIYGLDKSNKYYDLLCSYSIQCVELGKIVHEYPDDPVIGWGPRCFESIDIGLIPDNHPHSQIHLIEGDADIRMRTETPLTIAAELSHEHQDSQTLKSCLLVTESNSSVNINLRLPIKGEYGLAIFACEKGESNLRNVCNYLITCNSPSKSAPYPRFVNTNIGKGLYSDVFGLESTEGLTDTIVTNKAIFKIQFISKEKALYFCELTHHALPSSQLKDAIKVSQRAKKRDVGLQINLPACGEYGANIFAASSDVPQRLYHVHTYFIKYKVEEVDELTTPKDADDSKLRFTESSLVQIQLDVDVFGELHAELAKAHCNDNSINSEHVKLEEDDDLPWCICQLSTCGCYNLNIFESSHSGALERKQRHCVWRAIKEGDQVADMKGAYRMQATFKDLHMKIRRGKLKAAIAKQSLSALRLAIDEFDMEKLEKIREYELAQEALLKLQLEKDIRDASSRRSIEGLDRAITKVNKHDMRKMMLTIVVPAEKLLIRLKRIATFKKMIGELRQIIDDIDEETFANVQNYNSPPKPLFLVLHACYLLLGVDLDNVSLPAGDNNWYMKVSTDVKLWKQIVHQMAKESLQDALMVLQLEDISMQASRASHQLITILDIDDVVCCDDLASPLYTWCSKINRILDEVQGSLPDTEAENESIEDQIASILKDD